ncbi:MAG TPA: nicotinate-nucleotide adenylyltransferase [bacterium]|nr:nicotinate-nucleotide adenylyltransferase [bacterium]
MRVAVFGGTFDPIHVGHLIIAEQARELLSVEQVIFVTASQPPHKRPAECPPEQRLRMVELATQGNPYFQVSQVETNRKGPSYTIDTLRQILSDRSGEIDEMILLIGGDSLREFDMWKDWREIIQLSSLAVVPRPGVDLAGPPDALARSRILEDIVLTDISSTAIRRRIRKGQSIRYLVHDAVSLYIEQEGLYLREEEKP